MKGVRDGFFVREHQLAGVAAIVLFVLAALVAAGFGQRHAARMAVAGLQQQRGDDRRKLDLMERQTQALQKQNAESERTIEVIRRALGARKASAAGGPSPPSAALISQPPTVGTLAARLQRLQRAAVTMHGQTWRLSRLAARVLNLRRLASIARARVIAAIPSLNPVNGGINAAFGYRTDPFPEFHKGLDLAADYGAPVHAAAAGTVASAGWDGGFGIRVDIDHGNGFHTWYCHLSRVRVSAGEPVAKGDAVGSVGSTGESTGPHLHYQVMRDGVAIDPLPYLNGVPAKVLATLLDRSAVQ